jgi:hypothetical protein
MVKNKINCFKHFQMIKSSKVCSGIYPFGESSSGGLLYKELKLKP